MKSKLRIFIIAAVVLLISNRIHAQYEITVQIDNLTDSTIYLGYYFGDKQYAKDTAQLDSYGEAVFSSTDTLAGGLYFILLPGNSMFEIIIDKEQKFYVSTKYTGDPSDLAKNLDSRNNSELELYIDYQKFMTKQGELAVDLRKRLKGDNYNEVEKQQLKDSLQILNEKVKGKWDEISKYHSETLLASILKCLKEIEVPDVPKDENGNIIDSLFQYKYYKKHYFDNVNFADNRLLRTQFFHSKIDRYFEKMIVPAPDTIIKESKMVLDLAEANEEVFQYTLQTIFNKYNNSNIMGMDKAFVFFAENYYLNGRAEWADEEWLSKVKERVEEIKPNLVGNKAPELRLLKTDGTLLTLSSINADYIVLFFYDPTCGHCKKATPKILEISEKYWAHGVEVIGIYTQVEQNVWTKYIEDKGLQEWHNVWDPYNQSGFRDSYDVKTSPSIYLIDKEKRIIGKRIDAETLEKMLDDFINKKM